MPRTRRYIFNTLTVVVQSKPEGRAVQPGWKPYGKYPVNKVIEKLNTWVVEIESQLSAVGGDAELVKLKQDVRDAAHILKLCQTYGVKPRSTPVRIPYPKNLTPSSQFRLVEDQETDNRADWIEVLDESGDPIRPLPNSIIFEADL